MIETISRFCERILRIPPPPEPPPGDEATTRSFNAAPNYYRYLMFQWGIKTLFGVAGLILGLVFWFTVASPAVRAFANKHNLGGWMFLFWFFEAFGVLSAFALWIYSWFVVKLDYEKRWYVVTDRSLRVREGIVTVREATVTFANIQNISISQGPIQRLLGIADLRVDTAGGGAVAAQHQGMYNAHTTLFRGVANAEEIKQLMQTRLRQLKDAGLGDHDDTEQKEAETTADALEALREIHRETVLLRKAAGGA